jgi:urease accessory protein UreF
MLDQISKLPAGAQEVLGDLSALAEQLGGTDGLCQLPLGALAMASTRINDVRDLAKYLEAYVSSVLLPHELPAIGQAYRFATRFEVRELMAFDRELERNSAVQAFAQVSRAVGRAQLQRLRPLRSERLVQRYLKAVDESGANAWHTLVFGVVLAVYSLPLRQGLLHFAQQTLTGFVEAAGSRIEAARAIRHEILLRHTEVIAQAVEAIVKESAVEEQK